MSGIAIVTVAIVLSEAHVSGDGGDNRRGPIGDVLCHHATHVTGNTGAIERPRCANEEEADALPQQRKVSSGAETRWVKGAACRLRRR
jgi:hypothetical protein